MAKSKLVEIKTKQTGSDVEEYISKVPDEQKRKDCMVLLNMMQKASGEKPAMWGSSMIGFGIHRYKSPNTGREVDWFRIGFSPRKANISLHLVTDFEKQAPLLKKLGKHKTGAGCLYINKLEDVDVKVLEQIIRNAAGK
jgi:hypothetical protein